MIVAVAPNFVPELKTVCAKSTTSLSISWALPSPSLDADGYVIYFNSSDMSSMSVKVEGGDVSEYTLGGLSPSTKYTITIRAYQDILGPASEPYDYATPG